MHIQATTNFNSQKSPDFGIARASYNGSFQNSQNENS